MHTELIVPGLLSAPPELRLPAAELLLARGRATPGDALALEEWLLEAFGLADQPVAAGALSALGGGESPGDAMWLRADPVHLQLQRDGMLLVPGAALAIDAQEAAEVCEALNRQFAGQMAFFALRPDAWAVRLESGEAPTSESPLALAGQDVNANLPGGPAAKLWHARLNEIQMLLYDHPVNEKREARGTPAVNSVWPWGGGRLPGRASGPWQSVLADDPVALGLARHAEMRHRALPASATEWLERAPLEGRHLVVLDALRAPLALGDRDVQAARLRALDDLWFAPLLAALKTGRVGMVTLCVPDKGLARETIRGDLRRFWRRPRSLEHYA